MLNFNAAYLPSPLIYIQRIDAIIRDFGPLAGYH